MVDSEEDAQAMRAFLPCQSSQIGTEGSQSRQSSTLASRMPRDTGGRQMHESIDHDRRRLLATAAATIAAAQPGIGSAHAQSSRGFGVIKQIDAGLLSVGYAEAGPADGTPVILLHGWPYDIYRFVDVAPRLASKGYRVLVPYLRRYGTTRFLSSATLRNGQPSAVASAILAFMASLRIGKTTPAGFHLGPRTPHIIAARWSQRR